MIAKENNIQTNRTLMKLTFSVEDSNKIINEIINLKQEHIVTKNIINLFRKFKFLY